MCMNMNSNIPEVRHQTAERWSAVSQRRNKQRSQILLKWCVTPSCVTLALIPHALWNAFWTVGPLSDRTTWHPISIMPCTVSCSNTFLIRWTSVCLDEETTFKVPIWTHKHHQRGCHSVLSPCDGRQHCDLTFE
jgi:hypothetical protein